MKLKLIFFPALIVTMFFSIVACKKTKSTPDPVPVTPSDGTQAYGPSTEIFPNPDRGFIHTYPVYSEGAAISTATLAGLKAQNVTMLLRIYYLENFKTTALSNAELLLIQTDLNRIRTAGVKAILRFAYTETGTDASLSIIQQHLDQMQPIFNTNKDVIAFMQAGFIGPYGEWNTSTNGLISLANRTAVLNKILSVLPNEIMVQVRTPLYKQAIFGTAAAVGNDIGFTPQNRARVGHHNDCFLTGGDEYGTYSNITLEKQYVTDEGLFVPVGGETCPPTNGYFPGCTESKNQMQLLRYTYLNLDWYPVTVNGWRTGGCFDEFQTLLGYRLALVNAKLPDAATVNGNLVVNINLTNNGYAPVYNKKITSIVLKNKTTGVYYTKQLLMDIRTCKPTATLNINETISLSGIPAGDYDYFLRISDNATSLANITAYSLRLANSGTWTESNNGMNDLNHVLKIN